MDTIYVAVLYSRWWRCIAMQLSEENMKAKTFLMRASPEELAEMRAFAREAGIPIAALLRRGYRAIRSGEIPIEPPEERAA